MDLPGARTCAAKTRPRGDSLVGASAGKGASPMAKRYPEPYRRPRQCGPSGHRRHRSHRQRLRPQRSERRLGSSRTRPHREERRPQKAEIRSPAQVAHADVSLARAKIEKQRGGATPRAAGLPGMRRKLATVGSREADTTCGSATTSLAAASRGLYPSCSSRREPSRVGAMRGNTTVNVVPSWSFDSTTTVPP